MFRLLHPVFLGHLIYKRLQLLLLLHLRLHLPRRGILRIHLVPPPHQIVECPRYSLDLQRVHEAEGVRADHVVQDVEGTPAVDAPRDQVALHCEIHALVCRHLVALG